MATKTGKPAKGSGEARATKALRHLDESFEEWRHEPTARGSAYFGAVLLSFGGLLLGAGTFAFARITEGPWRANAWLLLVVGVVFEVGYLLLGGTPAEAVRVGELGVGVEGDGRVRRTAWCDIQRIGLVEDGLTLETGGGAIFVGFEQHARTIARLVHEAKRRIPKRVILEDDDVARLGEATGGQLIAAEPPQVTNAVCRATGEALTFEKDVRMCRSCGALYHRTGVPIRCTECSRKLKSA